ncbi:DNA translocase FtsK 4TM domain-containing protein [Fodinibius salsisoli]|uniref:DNA translocase FtsK 4TM domain-containing protein n=1 Tax=Fodinibius salsisoli TaxID=2820877 RepID=A0ABT3PRF0_9BACT|nr:DNA translocase FtsK 4TM domain-containing protein [Fodinibius salsisoli]MCW9708443.1 DNA translocase FtsK 4TM domain-containing protein [Fodinibius salsisoli]
MAKKNSSGNFLGGLTESRKMEIIGILIMAVGGLIGLSILSYHASDYNLIQSLSAESLLSIDRGPALRIQNGLGVVGAYLSHFFVYRLFGYISLLIPIVILFYGWFIFRNRETGQLLWPTAYAIWSMVLISSILGWFNNEYDWYSSVWSGSAGIATARVLQNITGIGSIIILGVLLVTTVLALLDRDLQTTVDTIKGWMADIKTSFAEWQEERRDKKAARQQQREAEAEQKEAEAQQKKVAQRQKAEQQMRSQSSVEKKKPRTQNNQPQEPEPKERTIDEIVEQSQEQDRERLRKQKEEVQSLDQRPRADVEKKKIAEEEDDVDISVYVGEGDEEADAKELDRQNKDKAKEVPKVKYKFPTIDLLDSPPNEGNEVDLEEIKENKRIILDKLKRHKIEIRSINAIVGPTVTLYELDPAPDVKISKIESYANDLKMATAAKGLRIMAPIPGRSAVGIEVPNGARETVFIKSVLNTKKFVESDFELPLAFGKTIENEVFMVDLTKMPHLLIAGATGSGKTVGMNTIITCLLYKCHPDDLKFVMIDPKKIELSLYQKIEEHFLATLPNAEEPIITDTTEAQETLESLTMEMDERYDLLKDGMVRDIRAYNEKFDNGELDEEEGHRHLPYIVVLIDELADLMMTAGKQIEEPIARLAQLARAVGIHLVVATQRPSVNVITGTIKANFPGRIAYQVASKVDSRTILDTGGADQLIGRGDMLFTNGGGMTRIQNAFVSTKEVEEITEFIGHQRGYNKKYELPVNEDESASSGIPDPLDDIDELFEAAAKVIVLHQQGSVSLLQRKLKIGYNRAGRIIDQLFNAGVVGPYQGSTARDVLVDDEEELEQLLDELDEFSR